MNAREQWGTPQGVAREWGLVGWGGAALRRLIRRRERGAWWALRRRAVARAVRQALGLVGPL